MTLKTLLPQPRLGNTSYPPGRLRAKLAALRATIATGVAKDAALVFPVGRFVPKAQVLAELDAVLGAFGAIDESLRQTQLLRTKLQADLPKYAELVGLLTNALRVMPGVPAPKPRRKPTSTEQVVAAAKLRETRRLRGTIGKRQKQKIKYRGPTPTIVVTPK